jgi:hypothetical protein
VTQQYDNGDSGHQDSPFSHKEITSIFMGREFSQAPLSPGSRSIHQAAKHDPLFAFRVESDVTAVENMYDIR